MPSVPNIYTDADVQAASEALHTNWGTDPKAPPADCEWATRIVLDAVAPTIAARAKAEAIRDMADDPELNARADEIERSAT